MPGLGLHGVKQVSLEPCRVLVLQELEFLSALGTRLGVPTSRDRRTKGILHQGLHEGVPLALQEVPAGTSWGRGTPTCP